VKRAPLLVSGTRTAIKPPPSFANLTRLKAMYLLTSTSIAGEPQLTSANCSEVITPLTVDVGATSKSRDPGARNCSMIAVESFVLRFVQGFHGRPRPRTSAFRLLLTAESAQALKTQTRKRTADSKHSERSYPPQVRQREVPGILLSSPGSMLLRKPRVAINTYWKTI
jgi:hypothetical protein